MHVMAATLFSASFLCGQQISGSITGVVKDSQQAAVAGAKVSINNQEQGTTRDATHRADGSFVFTQLQPGSYTIAVEATGFKKFEQKDVRVFANDRLSLGDIVLTRRRAHRDGYGRGAERHRAGHRARNAPAY